MSVGSSTLYSLGQSTPRAKLDLENSYFLIRLHEQQLFFPGNIFQQADHAIVSTAIESTFQPGETVQGLYRVATVGKNVPVGLGISANLTDWLPTRASDSVRVNLKYTMIQGAPFTKLINQMDKIGLTSEVSLLNANWAIAVKVSQIVGRLLDFLTNAGGAKELLTLTLDLNVSTLEKGYYAVVGSTTDEYWPPKLEIDGSGRLADPEGNTLAPLSYVVVEVLALPSLGPEKMRDEAWWEVLQTSKDQALAAEGGTKKEVDQALADWKTALGRVRAMARKSRAILQSEISATIQTAQSEVLKALRPSAQESATPLPEEWQELLGVGTRKQLSDAVQRYKTKLDASQDLLKQYAADEERRQAEELRRVVDADSAPANDGGEPADDGGEPKSKPPGEYDSTQENTA